MTCLLIASGLTSSARICTTLGFSPHIAPAQLPEVQAAPKGQGNGSSMHAQIGGAKQKRKLFNRHFAI